MIFEYALVHGVNADPAQAVELAGRLRGMQCHVNLIPLNSVPERGLTGVTEREVDAFKHTLEQKLSLIHIWRARRCCWPARRQACALSRWPGAAI